MPLARNMWKIFPLVPSKIYKLRQLSLSQFVYFLREVCLLINFWMIKFTITYVKKHKISPDFVAKPNTLVLRNTFPWHTLASPHTRFLGLDGTKVKILSENRPHLRPTASGACLRCHIVKNSPTNFTAIYGIICGWKARGISTSTKLANLCRLRISVCLTKVII